MQLSVSQLFALPQARPSPPRGPEKGPLAVRNIGKNFVPCNGSIRKFSPQGPPQQPFGLFAGEFQSEYVHEFGDGGLGGHVAAAEDAGFLEPQSGFVKLHRDASAAALGDVQHDHAAGDGLPQQADEPPGGRGVPRAVGFEHDGPQSRGRERRAQDTCHASFHSICLNAFCDFKNI